MTERYCRSDVGGSCEFPSPGPRSAGSSLIGRIQITGPYTPHWSTVAASGSHGPMSAWVKTVRRSRRYGLPSGPGHDTMFAIWFVCDAEANSGCWQAGMPAASFARLTSMAGDGELAVCERRLEPETNQPLYGSVTFVLLAP